ncbi:MAG: TIGR04255 family protein [Armatimonadetes bacterium]|nr:TIGR04255 family protein [Armatimonadota bacterium]
MSSKDLKNKPLVEAILELKWAFPTQAVPDAEVDPHYRLLLGRFSEKIERDYPFHELLPTAQIPDAMAAHMPQHRFRKSKAAWPLVQVGPGLMTVNETDAYTWSEFKALCENAVGSLYAAHPAKDDFLVQDLVLRYIDAVGVDFSRESVFAFLKDKMKTSISLPEELFEGGRVSKHPIAFNWQVTLPHSDPGGVITLRFAIGRHKNQPALIWETLVQAGRADIPSIPEEFSDWLTKAHDLTDDWFFKLIEGPLERKFSGV